LRCINSASSKEKPTSAAKYGCPEISRWIRGGGSVDVVVVVARVVDGEDGLVWGRFVVEVV
jgi:hypothetical protein